MFEKPFNWIGRWAVKAYARLMFKMSILWHAPLPKGPKIIAANHPSTTDPFLMTTLGSGPVSVLVHETLFKVPVFGQYLRRAGHIPVVPGNGRTALDRAQRLLNEGGTVVIFPEGDISPLEGGFLRPHTGVARLSLSTGAPVIPIGIHLVRERIHVIHTKVAGKSEVGTWYLRGPYAITIGKALHFEGNVENRDLVRYITSSVMKRIAMLAQQSAYRMHQNMGEPPFRPDAVGFTQV